MKKLVSAILSVLICLLGMQVAPVFAQEEYTLTLKAKRGVAAGERAEFLLYLVAAGTDSEFTLEENFSNYSGDLSNMAAATSERYDEICESLKTYIETNQVQALKKATLNADNKVVFGGLEQGLYFVPQVQYKDVQGQLVLTGNSILWLNQDTEVALKETTLPDNPTTVIPDDPNDPSGQKPGQNTQNPGMQNPGSQTGSGSSSIGVNTKDPSSAYSVNTAAFSQWEWYLMAAGAAFLVLAACVVFSRRKSH